MEQDHILNPASVEEITNKSKICLTVIYYCYSYQANISETGDLKVFIDENGLESVSITSEWGTQADSQKSDALNNIIEDSGDDVKTAVTSMKSLLGSMKDKNGIKRKWWDKKEAFKKLDALY